MIYIFFILLIISIPDKSHSMNLNKSSLEYDRQHSNQIKNLTTIINSILSSQQLLLNDDHLTPASFFIRYKFIFLIILSFSILIFSILIFLLILKRTHTEDTNIQRPQAAIEKHFKPEPNTIDNPQAPLLPQTDDSTINNIPISPNPHISEPCPNDPIFEKQSTDIASDTAENSSISISSPHLSKTNNDDDLAGTDFSEIRLRSVKLLNKKPIDPPPPENIIKPEIITQISDGSTTSEKSCV